MKKTWLISECFYTDHVVVEFQVYCFHVTRDFNPVIVARSRKFDEPSERMLIVEETLMMFTILRG